MADGTGQDASNFRKQILALEQKLAQALGERDDLARDVEALCMETTANTTFSSSSVLRERIFATGNYKTTSTLLLVPQHANIYSNQRHTLSRYYHTFLTVCFIHSSPLPNRKRTLSHKGGACHRYWRT